MSENKKKKAAKKEATPEASESSAASAASESDEKKKEEASEGEYSYEYEYNSSTDDESSSEAEKKNDPVLAAELGGVKAAAPANNKKVKAVLRGGPTAAEASRSLAGVVMSWSACISLSLLGLSIAVIVVCARALDDLADENECFWTTNPGVARVNTNLGLSTWGVVWGAFLLVVSVLNLTCLLVNRDRYRRYLSAAKEDKGAFPELVALSRTQQCIGCFVFAWVITGIVILAEVSQACEETYPAVFGLSIAAIVMFFVPCLLLCVLSCCWGLCIARKAAISIDE